MRRPLPPIHKRERRMTMPAHIRWMALRATVLATVVLGTAFAWTAGALAYDTGGTASLAAAVGESAVQDTVAASAGRGSATAGVDAVVDMLPPGVTTDPAPPALPMMNGNDNHWDMGSGWWIVMPIMMVLFWGAIIAVVVWGIRQFTGDRRRDRSALDIAKERLARGEITKEEFDRIRDDLT
jgi:putative membrane protein